MLYVTLRRHRVRFREVSSKLHLVGSQNYLTLSFRWMKVSQESWGKYIFFLNLYLLLFSVSILWSVSLSFHKRKSFIKNVMITLLIILTTIRIAYYVIIILTTTIFTVHNIIESRQFLIPQIVFFILELIC